MLSSTPSVRTLASLAKAPPSSPRTIRGVIFDFDGTITQPCIDFAEMRKRIGIPPGGDILEILKTFDPEARARADQHIRDVEAEALRNMRLMPGIETLCAMLDENRVKRAIVTRNVSASLDHFHSVHWLHADPFHPAISREFQLPYKPNPAALLHICEEWGVAPEEVVMIGDSSRDDVAAGRRAGTATILFDSYEKHRNGQGLEGDEVPDYLTWSMEEVMEVFRREFKLVPTESGKEASTRAA